MNFKDILAAKKDRRAKELAWDALSSNEKTNFEILAEKQILAEMAKDFKKHYDEATVAMSAPGYLSRVDPSLK